MDFSAPNPVLVRFPVSEARSRMVPWRRLCDQLFFILVDNWGAISYWNFLMGIVWQSSRIKDASHCFWKILDSGSVIVLWISSGVWLACSLSRCTIYLANLSSLVRSVVWLLSKNWRWKEGCVRLFSQLVVTVCLANEMTDVQLLVRQQGQFFLDLLDATLTAGGMHLVIPQALLSGNS